MSSAGPSSVALETLCLNSQNPTPASLNQRLSWSYIRRLDAVSMDCASDAVLARGAVHACRVLGKLQAAQKCFPRSSCSSDMLFLCLVSVLLGLCPLAAHALPSSSSDCNAGTGSQGLKPTDGLTMLQRAQTLQHSHAAEWEAAPIASSSDVNDISAMETSGASLVNMSSSANMASSASSASSSDYSVLLGVGAGNVCLSRTENNYVEFSRCQGKRSQRFKYVEFASIAKLVAHDGRCVREKKLLHLSYLETGECDIAAVWKVRRSNPFSGTMFHLESPSGLCMDPTGTGGKATQACETNTVRQLLAVTTVVRNAKLYKYGYSSSGGKNFFHTHGSYGYDRLGLESENWAEVMAFHVHGSEGTNFKIQLKTGRGAGKWLHVHQDSGDHLIGPADSQFAATFEVQYARSYTSSFEYFNGGLPDEFDAFTMSVISDGKQHGSGRVGLRKVGGLFGGDHWRLSAGSAGGGSWEDITFAWKK